MMTESRSVYTGPLIFGRLKIPVSVYRATDEYGLPGALYHEGCGGKVRELRYCEDHGNEEVTAFSGVDILGTIVPVNSEIRDKLLGRSDPLKVVSAHKMNQIPQLLLDGLVVNCRYMVQHSALPRNGVDLSNAKLPLANLFHRLAAKKLFLLCTVGLSGCKRYALLLPDGQLLTVYYAEELRDFPPVIPMRDKEIASHIDEALDGAMTDFPSVLSLSQIRKKVDNWFHQHITVAMKPRRGKKKSQKEKVNA
jgi:hypothetical protein